MNQLNIHADYAMQSLTNLAAAPGVKNTDNGISTIKIGALGQADVNDTNSIRPFVDFEMDSDNQTDLSKFNDSDWDATLGASCVHKVNGGKGLVSTGLLVNFANATNKAIGATTTTETDEAIWEIVWNGSVESQVADWLTLRAGIEKPLVSRYYQSTATTTYVNNAAAATPVAFNTGFGITWQNFTLNGMVSASSLENSINNVQPGNGLLFTNGNNIVTVEEADLAYKF
jgi:hypothetical protein